jgi:hypothetical protein
MNLNLIFQNKRIKELRYDYAITERPMSNLIDFDYKTILKPPEPNNSKKTEKELSLISYATTNRKNTDVEFIHNVDQDMDSFFIGLLNKQNLEYPYRYIGLFYDIVEPVLMNTKSFWNRPRPSQLAKLYNIPIDVIATDTIHTASYPSGHTVYAKLVANILTEKYPKLADQLEATAKNIGIARIQQGVHYPSDNDASFVFSNFVYQKLQPRLKRYQS